MRIQSFTAFTREIDDVDVAVAELLRQLDLGGKNKLRKHTVGIVSCYAEYIESGVWAALCEKLPFEVIGLTTIANMTAGELGETMLCLMALTSDEVCFATGLSAPIASESEASLRDLYRQAREKLPEGPALMLSFCPLLNHYSSDFYVDRMTEISGNVPNFGALAVDHNPDYHESQVLLNGESWKDRFAILLICGPIEPVFYVGTISDNRIFSEKSVVTDTDKNQLRMIDNVPAADYLKTIGLEEDESGNLAGINSFPLIVDYNDGTAPLIRAMFALTPEGYVVCGGHIPVGASLSIGSFDSDEITSTSLRSLNRALAARPYEVLLMYSCIGRYFSMGYRTMAELELLVDPLRQAEFGYMAAYSGGELCPAYDARGQTVNRNHNNTFVICGF